MSRNIKVAWGNCLCQTCKRNIYCELRIKIQKEQERLIKEILKDIDSKFYATVHYYINSCANYEQGEKKSLCGV